MTIARVLCLLLDHVGSVPRKRVLAALAKRTMPMFRLEDLEVRYPARSQAPQWWIRPNLSKPPQRMETTTLAEVPKGGQKHLEGQMVMSRYEVPGALRGFQDIVTLSLNCLKNNTREASTRGHRPRGHRPHRPRGRTCARRPTHDPLTHPYAAKKGSTGSGQVQVSTGANWTWIFGVRFWCFFPRWLSFFPIEGSFFLSLSFVFFDVIF